MAQNLQICEIGDEVKQTLKKFRFRKDKNIGAIILKIKTDSMKVEIDESFEDSSIEEIKECLPERTPRYLVLSYVRNHSDGRVSYPLIFIYISPNGCKPEISMMYAGTRNILRDELRMSKDFELREVDDFDEEWLEDKLSRIS